MLFLVLCNNEKSTLKPFHFFELLLFFSSPFILDLRIVEDSFTSRNAQKAEALIDNIYAFWEWNAFFDYHKSSLILYSETKIFRLRQS